MSEWDSEREARMALALEPLLNEIMAIVRAKLPTGTDFGVFILAKPVIGTEGRVVAVTTDRKRVGTAVAQWITSAANPLDVKQRRRR